MIPENWDYLILTAGNETQAAAYRQQLDLRRELGLLRGADQTLVLADPDGRRVGSGGSTMHCLIAILNREFARRGRPATHHVSRDEYAGILQSLRIFIIHAGGDSQQQPADDPCGPIFTPVPVPSDGALENTLFDIQWPIYRRIPSPSHGGGQVVICSGNVLLDFDPAQIQIASPGVTGLGCRASPQQASRHGVFCLGPGGQVRRFLQKPSLDCQRASGAIDGFGRSVLDIGVVHFDAAVAASLLELCGARSGGDGQLGWNGPIAEAIGRQGLDFYREILCALGSESSEETYRESIRACDSVWSDSMAAKLFAALSSIPFQTRVLRECTFGEMAGCPATVRWRIPAITSKERSLCRFPSNIAGPGTPACSPSKKPRAGIVVGCGHRVCRATPTRKSPRRAIRGLLAGGVRESAKRSCSVRCGDDLRPKVASRRPI